MHIFMCRYTFMHMVVRRTCYARCALGGITSVLPGLHRGKLGLYQGCDGFSQRSTRCTAGKSKIDGALVSLG